MPRVAIVTDSTADIPIKLMQKYPIFVAPQHVIWGEETFRAGIEINNLEFYQRLKRDATPPTTSQPSVGVFKNLYTRLLEEGHEIVSVHISSKLSGTIDSAQQAKDLLAGAPIEILDSQTASMALGLQVLNVARAVRQGANLSECKIIFEQSVSLAGVYFMVDTLEYLHRGGRIGGAAAFLGTLMDLKPMLTVEDGIIAAVEKVRSSKKAQQRLLDMVEKQVGTTRPVQVSALHTNAPDIARALLEQAKHRLNISKTVEPMITDATPVIGAHTGPGCVGLAFMSEL
jgi:DegV family protein with EDD domain